ncbi:hypothetical protein CRENBAI_012211 [Crenichthys baileyi]|uniref:Retrotransposon gag domain-containing protein n=1 Tax=Crenichthys baileyi TaxID=28760 RepID=A0AAV9S5L2_9TELE
MDCQAWIPLRFLRNFEIITYLNRGITWTTYQLAIRLSPALPNLFALQRSSCLQSQKPWWTRAQLSAGLDSRLSLSLVDQNPARSAFNTMTEQSGQPDPTEALQRTVSDHSHQIHSHGATIRNLLEQQRQTNQQLKQMQVIIRAEARFSNCNQFGCSYEDFIKEFKLIFDLDMDPSSVPRCLRALRQCNRPLTDFTLEFRTLAVASALATRLDIRLRERRRCRIEPEPMQ